MSAILFHATIDKDQVIRPPEGVVLPRGEIEVQVRPLSAPAGVAADPLAPTRSWLLDLVATVEKAAPDLPSDLAEHHDHYAHGKPLP